MKSRKKYLLFTMLVLGFGMAGINGYLPKEDNTRIIKAAQTDFVIDDNGTLEKYNGTGKKVVIPNGVYRIADSAFSGCRKMVSVTIPKSVTKIGDGVFDNCPALKEIIVESGSKKYKTKDGVLFKKEKSGLELLTYPAKRNGETYKIPNKVKSIKCGAFSGCKQLTGLIIPGNMTNLSYEKGAFFGFTNLRNLKINMKKGKKVYISVALNLWNEDGGAMPVITPENKKIADITMSKDGGYFEDDDIDHALVEGFIKAKKKGKTEIIFQRTDCKKKKISDIEFELEEVKVKTTLEITVK